MNTALTSIEREGPNTIVNIMGQSRVNQLGRRFINGRPLPMQTRHQIIRMHNEGIKPCNISRQLQVSHGAVSKILNRYAETGSIEPGKIGGNPRSRLAVQSVQGFIQKLVRGMPEASAADICEALIKSKICTRDNVPTACSINRHLRSRGLKRRKNLHEQQTGSHYGLIEADTSKDTSNETEWDEAAVSYSSVSSSADSHLSPDSFLREITATTRRRFTDADFDNNEDDDDDEDNNNNDVDVSSMSYDETTTTDSGTDLPNDRTTSGVGATSGYHRVEFAKLPAVSTASHLTYGISAILGAVTSQNFAKSTSNDLSKNAHLTCDASTSLVDSASSPTSDEENRLVSPSVSKGVKNSSIETLHCSTSTASSPSSMVMPDSSSGGCGNMPKVNGRPLDTFTKWAETTGGLAEYRRNRTSFTSEQLRIMENSFKKGAYPDEEERERLIRSTNLDDDKIITWFSNRRARFRKFIQKRFPQLLAWLTEGPHSLWTADPALLSALLTESEKSSQKQPSPFSSQQLECLNQLIQQQQTLQQLQQQQKNEQQDCSTPPHGVALQLLAPATNCDGLLAQLPQQQLMAYQLQCFQLQQQRQQPLRVPDLNSPTDFQLHLEQQRRLLAQILSHMHQPPQPPPMLLPTISPPLQAPVSTSIPLLNLQNPFANLQFSFPQ